MIFSTAGLSQRTSRSGNLRTQKGFMPNLLPRDPKLSPKHDPLTNFMVSFVVMTVLLAAIYKILPEVPLARTDVIRSLSNLISLNG